MPVHGSDPKSFSFHLPFSILVPGITILLINLIMVPCALMVWMSMQVLEKIRHKMIQIWEQTEVILCRLVTFPFQ